MASSLRGGAYHTTARLLNEVWSTRKSLKTLVYDAQGNLTCSKATYALCTKVLACQSTLRHIVKSHCPDLLTAVRNQGLLYAAVYELVAGPHQKIQGGGAVKRHILRHEAALRAAWKQEQPSLQETNENNDGDDNDNSHDNDEPPEFPRYLRVNTLRTSTEQVVQYLRDELHLESVEKDAHIPDLLVLPRNATSAILQQSSKRYDWVLQDKSSCFSAYCLVHGFTTATSSLRPRVYLDACAAPGNKTTHLAALAPRSSSSSSSSSSNTHHPPVRIYALDRSPFRYESLQRRVQQHLPDVDDGATKVQVHTSCSDFLTLTSDNETYVAVTDILLDPSCSGSGIFNRQGSSNNATCRPDRLKSLAAFQKTALIHALTKFENVQRVVYSTCSLHEEENEGVVAEVLETCGDTWRLVAPACLQSWQRRGHVTAGLTPKQAATLIRVDRPDQTNGFFVSCWERIGNTTVGYDGQDGQDGTSTAVIDTTATPTSRKEQQPEKKLLGKDKTHDTTTKQKRSIAAPVSHSKSGHSVKSQAKKQVGASDKESSSAMRQPAWVKQSGKKKRKRR